MSEDLISRKTIKSQIETIRDCWGISPFVSSSDMKLYAKAFNVVLQTISDCHTAFDKEKVIEELKSAIGDIHYTEDGSFNGKCIEDFEFIQAKTALEIIEKGGVE